MDNEIPTDKQEEALRYAARLHSLGLEIEKSGGSRSLFASSLLGHSYMLYKSLGWSHQQVKTIVLNAIDVMEGIEKLMENDERN